MAMTMKRERGIVIDFIFLVSLSIGARCFDFLQENLGALYTIKLSQ